MTEDVDGLIERQRADDDCTICAIAMATGLSYERVMEAAVAMDAGGYRYAGKPGTMSPKGLLMALGFEATRVGLAAIPPGHAKGLLWGRRAILSIPSLNGFPGHHDVYWDGRAIRDPSQKLTYPPNAAWSFQPIWAVLLDDASALKSLKQELDAALSGERGLKELLHKVEGERDEARILVSKYAREAGEATGRLETSEAAGIVDGWRQRAETAERELAAFRELREGDLWPQELRDALDALEDRFDVDLVSTAFMAKWVRAAERAEAALQAAQADLARMDGLWDWLATRTDLELDWNEADEGEGIWRVFRISGHHDRKWKLIATGDTPLLALLAARAALQPQEGKDA